MSIKIYDGYKINVRACSFHHLMLMLDPVGGAIRREAQRLETVLMASLVCELLDDQAMGDLPSWAKERKLQRDSAVSAAFLYVSARRSTMNDTHRRDPSVDFGFQVCLLPNGLDSALAIIYTEQKSLKQIWEAQRFVEAYPYWNNTDPPEGVTDEQWNTRGDEWEVAIGPTHVPAHRGLSFQPVHNSWLAPPSVLEIAMAMPPLDQRVDRLARQWMLGHMIKVAGAGPGGSRSLDVLMIGVRCVNERAERLKTPEGQKELAFFAEQVRPKLKSTITRDDIRENREWHSISNA